MAPASQVPPPLPPSVEEAYHRKCIQLKQRTAEVEEANAAAQLRLNRLKRQVEKMRLERAFLLEQLQRRNSTNVEDSEGSPSPPPTPKDKPLRIKRGHRKASLLANIETPPPGGSSSLGPSNLLTAQNLNTLSPSSDAYSHSQQADNHNRKATNGASSNKASKKAASAFEVFSAEVRPSIDEEDDKAVEDELARRWKELPESRREEYQSQADRNVDNAAAASSNKLRKESDRSSPSAKAVGEGEVDDDDGQRQMAEDTPLGDQRDEDVEMGNYDSGEETQGEH
ncbi:hypothetical protein DL546_009140 [Coniochaeta pulveracea]|uniref:HMG box domain-containing protein n=1 Tax=Coniochaeta pulveracea TaxID=177199 RepID=A0A420YJ87_9PEZI|nr:hypothetical protein DL546_009140 [Coniochaeta pulveracea]